MLGYSDVEATDLPAGTITAQEVAESVVEGLARETFLILPHPDVAKYIQFKSADYDKWLNSMVRLRAKIVDELGSVDIMEIHRVI